MRLKKLLFSLLLVVFATTYASEYNCQKAIELSQQCVKCQTQKNCNSYHSTYCPKLPVYQKKCQNYITKMMQEQKENNKQIVPPKDESPLPVDQYNGRGQVGSDLNEVIPDVPMPAPGMENRIPSKSDGLNQPPPSNFIMQNWY